jgi:hypothetical protein
MFTTIHGFNSIAMLQCRQEDPLFFLVALAVADLANIWQLSFCSCRAFALFYHPTETLEALMKLCQSTQGSKGAVFLHITFIW